MPPNRRTPQQSQLTMLGSKSGAFSASSVKHFSSTLEITLDTISRRYTSSKGSRVLPPSRKKKPSTLLFDSEHYRALLLQFIAANNLPLSIVESPALENLHKFLHNDAGSVSRQTIGADLRRVYGSQVSLIKARLASTNCKFALVVDTYTSPTNSCFLAVTLQYHDESYQFQTLAVGFENLDNGVAHCLCGVLTEYGIEDRIISITRNDDETMDSLAQLYAGDSELKGLGFNGDIRSIGHVFSGLAEMILDHTFFKVNDTESFRESVENTEAKHPELGPLFQGMRSLPWTIRSIIRSISDSPVLARAFLEKAEKKEKLAYADSAVLDDMGYAWLSTFDMIDRFIFFREEITSLYHSVGSMGDHSFDHKTMSITDSQWEYLSGVHKILSLFRQISIRHHASSTPKTSQIATSVLTFRRRLNELKSDAFVANNPLILMGLEAVSKAVIEYYPRGDDDIGPMKKVYLATVLDPRFKLFPFIAEGYSPRTIDDLKSYFYEEYGRYEEDYKREQESARSILGDDGDTNTDNFDNDDLFTYLNELRQDEDHNIELYLNERRSYREVDVMEYYEERKSMYPVIGRMARDYLAISPVTAPARAVCTRVSKAIKQERNPSSPSTIKMKAILKSQGVFGDDGQIVEDSEKSARCEENNGEAGKYGVGQYLVSDQKGGLS